MPVHRFAHFLNSVNVCWCQLLPLLSSSWIRGAFFRLAAISLQCRLLGGLISSDHLDLSRLPHSDSRVIMATNWKIETSAITKLQKCSWLLPLLSCSRKCFLLLSSFDYRYINIFSSAGGVREA
ncbi:uncharacterized protein BT62DRAFT_764703 [Guyanagaster necrorhizus]|uniref:Uncharacterized protein n=1 Tax=Guyanagaster necrorhizus TaxID=856835 RepID=A0A9P8AUB3_9AGAR|nr:uncharacterized protein BT62DRAFT_764703 [Guyanagaster necrorhizus MCA 3950]KAG7448309.1 hypothetical protein BT62DRAFT_764703 [Guyanagaster necrorhizus MCA 3950]